MGLLTRRLRIPAAVLLLGTYASGAHAVAVSVSCPGTLVTTDREFTLTTDPGTATCFAYGTGNVNGNSDPINVAPPGYLTLDKSDDTTTGALPLALSGSPSLTSGLSGTFSFSAPGYKDFIIAFKSGEGQLDPDWAAFSLPAGVTSGSWSISGQQELSHVNLYGRLAKTVVPLPATAWLLLTGIAGLGALARRRRLVAA